MSQKLDAELEEKLHKHLDKLRRKIDWIADRDLRQTLDEHATLMYRTLKEYQEVATDE